MDAGKLKKLLQLLLFATRAITEIYGDQAPFTWKTTAKDVRNLRQKGTT
jgi:hypothetical protein